MACGDERLEWLQRRIAAGERDQQWTPTRQFATRARMASGDIGSHSPLCSSKTA